MKRLLPIVPLHLILFTMLLSSLISCHSVEEEIDSSLISKNFHGAVLVAENNRVLFSRGYGYADDKAELLNTPETKFQIGSITKQFTAACILLLEERGLLKTSDPINLYVEYPAGDYITIESLITHTSGIPPYLSYSFFHDNDLEREYSPEEIVAFIPLEKEWTDVKNRRFHYSNSNYLLLGMIIEKVSGMSYERFLEENILKPLEMNDTGTEGDYLSVDGIALGYTRVGVSYARAMDMNLTVAYAAGGIYSTCEDLFKWHKALSGDFLSEESLEKMYKVWNGDKNGYAYGWEIEEFDRSVSHGGGIPGFLSYIYRRPEQDQVYIILSNMESSWHIERLKYIFRNYLIERS